MPAGGAQETGRLQRFIEPKIAMVVGDKTSLNPVLEGTVQARLNALFGDVDIYDDADLDSGNANLMKYDLVIVFQSIVDTNVDELKVLEIPILSLKGSVSKNILNISASNGTKVAVTSTDITDNTHNITRLRATGTVSICPGGGNIDFVSAVGIGARALAQDPATAAEKELVVVDRGGLLQTGLPAPETRVHFGYFEFNKLNNVGHELFDEAVAYCLAGKEVSRGSIVEIEEAVKKPFRFGLGLAPLREGARLDIEAWYLRTGGNDANEGKNWATAKATMASILAHPDFKAGDHIFVEAGTYSEAVNINVADVEVYATGEGTQGAAGFQHLAGHQISAPRVKVIGVAFTNLAGSANPGLRFPVTIIGLTMRNCFIQGIAQSAMNGTNLTQADFERCTFQGNGAGIESLEGDMYVCRFLDCIFTNGDIVIGGGGTDNLFINPSAGQNGALQPSISVGGSRQYILSPKGFAGISGGEPFLHKTPVWRRRVTATHTTSGTTEEIMFTTIPKFLGARAVGHLRLVNMVAGDDFTFRTYKSDDGGTTYDLIVQDNRVGAQTLKHRTFDEFLERDNTRLQVRIQRNSATNRSFDWTYNVLE